MAQGPLQIVDDDDRKEDKKIPTWWPKTLKRGMLVVLNSPNEGGKLVVKRVVGLPGDIVEPLARKNKLRRGGRSDIDREKMHTPTDASACPHSSRSPDEPPASEPVLIPAGHVWIEGDNPDASWDSNDYGPVSQSLITEAAYGHAGLPWNERAWRKVRWEDDGWETKMGLTSADNRTELRLRKRENLSKQPEYRALDEWRVYRQDDT